MTEENKQIDIDCGHKRENSTYIYELGDNRVLWLCKCCNMNLAGEIMKQVALEVFIPKLK